MVRYFGQEMVAHYRVYVRLEGRHCVRFLAPGDGSIATCGVELFEWIRNPVNIQRLRKGLEHTYEVHDNELAEFLTVKLVEDEAFVERQMQEYRQGITMLRTFERKRARFELLQSGVEKLEVIAEATDILTIPRTAPRVESDRSEWLYMLNLDDESLEVYEFRQSSSSTLEPRATMATLLHDNPLAPPGYYIKMAFSDLRAMWRSDWIAKHRTHEESLQELWQRSAHKLLAVRFVDEVPFSALYGKLLGDLDSQEGLRKSTRIARVRLLRDAMATVGHARAKEIKVRYADEAPGDLRSLAAFHLAWEIRREEAADRALERAFGRRQRRPRARQLGGSRPI
ncbi:hypothetical protein F4780DRAFT_760203 [Xylariomycetidae sp. FL0641]|nr:hypothetical protein F4780DRAFT_760203 [Xylariomycetidae sp. FL0641]